jgi:uncharacterized YigZ family protein
MSTYRTVVAPFRAEIPKIRGSRFIADLAPAAAERDAEVVLERVRRELPAARHYCHAWRIGRSGENFRFGDDGEPSGTAGRPILQRLEGRGVTNAILVVTRYFGGTKLGAGGLARAYGGAAAAVLEAAEIREIDITRRVMVLHTYEDSAIVRACIAARGLEAADAVFGERIRLALDVPEADVPGMVEELRDRTAGRAGITVGEAP